MQMPGLSSFVGPGGAALIIGVIAVIRKAWPRIPSKYIPLLAIFLGNVLNVAIALTLGNPLLEAVILGIVAGLSSVGLYATATRLIPGERK